MRCVKSWHPSKETPCCCLRRRSTAALSSSRKVIPLRSMITLRPDRSHPQAQSSSNSAPAKVSDPSTRRIVCPLSWSSDCEMRTVIEFRILPAIAISQLPPSLAATRVYSRASCTPKCERFNGVLDKPLAQNRKIGFLRKEVDDEWSPDHCRSARYLAFNAVFGVEDKSVSESNGSLSE